MIFDPKRRVYVENGRILSPAAVRKHIDDYINHEQALVIKEAQRLMESGDVSAFFAFMESRITSWHGIAGSIAYGGEAQMNATRWARINARIRSELAYLADFQDAADHSFTAAQLIANKVARTFGKSFPDAQAEVRDRVSRALFTAAPSEAATIARQTAIEVVGGDVAELVVGPEAGFLMGAQIEPRAAMYPHAIWTTHEMETVNRERDNGVTLGRRICEKDGASCDECVAAATEEFIPLDQIDEIGSLQCMNNCRCEFEFGDEGGSFRTSEIFSGVIAGQPRYGGSVGLN